MAKNHLFQLTIYVISIVLSRAQAVTDEHDRILDKALLNSQIKSDLNLNGGHLLLQNKFEPVKYNLFAEADNDENTIYHPNNRLSQLPDYLLSKRVPTGFMGMRGKREWEYLDPNRDASYYGWSPLLFGDKRASRFYGVRGERYRHNNVEDDNYGEDYPWVGDNDLKHLSLVEELGNALNKRSLSGFNDEDGRGSYLNFNNPTPKRNHNRFYASRGKKDEQSQPEAIDDFFEERGKKLWSFFGSRGKKQPTNSFRNKFVGVRGKKSSDGSLQQLESQLIDTLPGPQFSTSPMDMNSGSGVDLSSVKRVPNGFIGMRGKRDQGANLLNSI